MEIMSLSEIMDRSVDILKKYIKTILLYALSYGAISVGIISILMIIGIIFGAIIYVILKTPIFLIIFLIIAAVLSIFVSLSINIGMIKIASQEFTDEKISSSNALGASFKSIPRIAGFFATNIILFLPILGFFSGIVFLLYSGFKNSQISHNVYGSYEIVLIILSIITVLAAFLSIFLYETFFVFSFQVMGIEKKGFIVSVKRSFVLVKACYWRIFGCCLLFYLTTLGINYSIRSLFTLILSLIYLILHFFITRLGFVTFITMSLNLFTWPLYIFSWLVLSPLGTIMLTMLYYNQRFKREGYDIELKLKGIEKKDVKEQSQNATQFNNYH